MEKLRRKVYLEEDSVESRSLLGSVDDEYLHLGNLHPKKREDISPSCRSPLDQTIQCDIQPSDTLQSLALKYNIPLAELKRVNKILKESEFYALKRIKIPVKPQSFLRDLIPGVHSEENRKENGWFVDHRNGSPPSNLSSGVSTGCSSPCSETENPQASPQSKDKRKVRRFLKEMDKDLERIKERQSNKDETEELALDDTSDNQEVVYTHFSDPDDSGLSNGSMVCWCFLLVLLALSLLAILMALMSIDHHSSLFQEEANLTETNPSS